MNFKITTAAKSGILKQSSCKARIRIIYNLTIGVDTADKGPRKDSKRTSKMRGHLKEPANGTVVMELARNPYNSTDDRTARHRSSSPILDSRQRRSGADMAVFGSDFSTQTLLRKSAEQTSVEMR